MFDTTVEAAFPHPLTADERAALRTSWSRCLLSEAEAALEVDGDLPDGIPAGALPELVVTAGTPDDHCVYCAWVSAEEADPADAQHVSAEDFAQFQESLTSAITLEAIRARVGRNLMFHAAGLADPSTGNAIALVASSGTGKTTASIRLGRELAYLTDETVFLDGLAVRPYPKPLSVIESPDAPKRQISPDELGLLPTPASATLRALVLLERLDSSEPTPVRVTKLGAADALHALVPNISGAPAFTRPLSLLLGLFEDVGGVFRITYPNDSDLLPVLRSLLSSEPVEYLNPPYDEVSVSLDDDADRPSPGAGMYRRCRARQAAFIDDRLLIMTDESLVEISDLGHSIWSALSSWRTLEEIVDEVQSIHGEHPEAADIVGDSLQELERQGLVEKA